MPKMLIIAPDLQVDKIERGSVWLYSATQGRALRLTRSAYDVLRTFYHPTDVRMVYLGHPARAQAMACVRSLFERGLLRDVTTLLSPEAIEANRFLYRARERCAFVGAARVAPAPRPDAGGA